jgi:hypothetical protein
MRLILALSIPALALTAGGRFTIRAWRRCNVQLSLTGEPRS